MKFKSILSTVIATAMMAAMVGCGAPVSQAPAPTAPAAEAPATVAPAPVAEAPAPAPEAPAAKEFHVAMVTDTGGVNDQSFNQSSWEGLQQAEKEYGAKVKFLESKQEADYSSNLDKLADEGQDLIWGVGFMMGDAVKNAAQQNPDKMYAIVDYAYPPADGANLIGVVFKAQEPSFEVGYIAARTTQTNKVGFVGGVKGDIIDQFEYGYRAGVAYAAKELGKTIDVDVQYADSFADDAKGKAIATQMYTNGCDVVFHAAGNVGKGVFEAAKEFNKYVIGVDRDQSEMAPEQCLTSAMKLVGKAMYLVSKDVMDGKGLEIGGTTVVYGLAEGGVGVPDSKLVAPEVATATKALEPLIVDGTIAVPFNEETFNAYVGTLK